MRAHAKYGNLICQICWYKSKDEETCKSHVQAHKIAIEHQCVICNRTCSHRKNLRLHVQNHV